MALNPNHTFEDLGDKKCSIVEKNCTPGRAEFLNQLLSLNGFEVVVLKSPPPKAAKAAVAAAPAAEGGVADAAAPAEPAAPLPPDTFTVGVTDLTFNPANAVFNRDLKTAEGVVVIIAYWKQQETAPGPDEWYWKK